MNYFTRLFPGLLLAFSSFGQEIDLDFSNTIQNAGDPVLQTTGVGAYTFGMDRQNGTTCALSLDYPAKNGYVKAVRMNTLDFTSPFSISIWFRTYNNGSEQYLFTKGINASTFADFSINIVQGTVTGGSTLPDYALATASSPTKWYHYVMVHDGDSISTYLDNVLKSRLDLDVTTIKSDTALIGYHFAGNIDQFQFYSYPLTKNEVNSLFIATSSCKGVITDLYSPIALENALQAEREDEQIVLSSLSPHNIHYHLVDLQGRTLSQGVLEGNSQIRISLTSSSLVLLKASDAYRQYRKKL